MSKLWSFWTPGVKKMSFFGQKSQISGFGGHFWPPLFDPFLTILQIWPDFAPQVNSISDPPKSAKMRGSKKGQFSWIPGGTPFLTRFEPFFQNRQKTSVFTTKKNHCFSVFFGSKMAIFRDFCTGSYLGVLVKKWPFFCKKRVFNDAGSLALFVTFFSFSHFWPFQKSRFLTLFWSFLGHTFWPLFFQKYQENSKVYTKSRTPWKKRKIGGPKNGQKWPNFWSKKVTFLDPPKHEIWLFWPKNDNFWFWGVPKKWKNPIFSTFCEKMLIKVPECIS